MLKKPSKQDIINKWSKALGPIGITGSQLDNISQLIEDNRNDFSSLLPLAMKVSSKLLSNDSIFASKEQIEEVEKRIQSENREGKIESIVEGKEFVEKKLEDDEEYQRLKNKGVQPLSAPSGLLFYIDYIDYKSGDNKTHKKTRRAGKKHKKKKIA